MELNQAAKLKYTVKKSTEEIYNILETLELNIGEVKEESREDLIEAIRKTKRMIACIQNTENLKKEVEKKTEGDSYKYLRTQAKKLQICLQKIRTSETKLDNQNRTENERQQINQKKYGVYKQFLNDLRDEVRQVMSIIIEKQEIDLTKRQLVCKKEYIRKEYIIDYFSKRMNVQVFKYTRREEKYTIKKMKK